MPLTPGVCQDPQGLRILESMVGPIFIEESPFVSDRTAVLNRLADCLLDDLPLEGNGEVDFNMRCMRFKRGLGGCHMNHNPNREYLIVTPPATTLDNEPLLFNQ